MKWELSKERQKKIGISLKALQEDPQPVEESQAFLSLSSLYFLQSSTSSIRLTSLYNYHTELKQPNLAESIKITKLESRLI
mmetsp:Transcript_7887/g.10831  ORF Transcript_7887/g.10831 Transcript_7887/m.10831 type:complete len:81 (-) Transcript_7887:91-333(-)